MKKIFAIALALVMVLAMTSAFASPCTAGFDWTKTSTTNCGKAAVEVVPYVKVPNGCGGFEWQVSECAAAVATEEVFFAVKLTVDANPDSDWVDDANLKLSFKGLDATERNFDLAGVVKTATKQEVYYLGYVGNQWIWGQVGTDNGDITVADNVENAVVNNGYIFPAVVNGKTVKVCATLTSGGEDFVKGVVGEYWVEYTKNSEILVYDSRSDAAADYLAKFDIANDKVVKVDYTKAKDCAPNDMASIKAFFGLDEGVAVTQKLVNDNFGWDDKVEDCFTWGAAASIVDAECVVAIPKTGDASVLAWLF